MTALSFPAATLAQQAAEGPGPSILDFIQGGGPIGYLIIALSILAVALIIKHLIQIREASLAPADTVEALDELLSRGDVEGAIAFCAQEENQSFLTRIVGAGLERCRRSPFGWLELKGALEEAGQEQVARLYRSTDLLGLIIAVAPMLGLLGTVVGMVGAFDVIATTEGFPRADQLAGDISVALITTVLGLVVAIPCMAAYTYFRNRIDAVSGDIAGVVEELAAHLEETAEPPAASRSAPPATARPTPGASPS